MDSLAAGSDGARSPDGASSETSSLSFQSLSSSEGSEAGNAALTGLAPSERRRLSLQSHIEDTIDRLQEQARRIERAAAQHRRERVEVYQNKERPRQVYEGFKKLGMWKANDTFAKASDELKDRMAESFARRRIRFEYLKEHQRKKRTIDLVAGSQSIPLAVAQPHAYGVQKLHSSENTKSIAATNNSSAPYPKDLETIFSATVHTRLDFRVEPKKMERAESVKSIALANAGLPPPPTILNGRFQCPYCLLDFRAREAEKGHWR
jgi:hypothetical protein